MKIINLLVCFLSASGVAFAQGEGLTLDRAVRDALDRSPEIQYSRASEEVASAKKQESLSGFLPTLSASAYHLTNVKYQSFSVVGLGPGPLAVPVVVPQTSLKFTATLPIFDGLRNLNEYKAASALQESAMNENEWREFTIDQEVRRAYYRALAAQKLAEVAAQNIKTLEDHATHVEARKKGGVATQYDVLRVEVQLDEAKSQKLLADDNVILERKRLARVMGLPDDQRELTGELPTPTELKAIEELTVENAVNDRKDILALRQTEQSTDLAKAAQHFWWVPSFGAFTDYEIYNNSNFSLSDSSAFHNAYDVGLSLHWNLFDGGASIAKAREASAKLRQSHASVELETQKLPENLETWKRRYAYGSALYRTATSDIRKSEESVRQAQEGFKQGVRAVSEQLDAQLDLFRSRASQVNAQLTAAEALINLELTVGRKI
jgi:outer membrane protein TolC